MRTYKVTQGPRYVADAKMVLPEPYHSRNSVSILFSAKSIVSYKQIISSLLHVRLKGSC